MYIALRQGQTTPWGQNFDVNRNSLSLCPFVASLKKSLWSLMFYRFLHIFYTPRQKQTTHWGQNFYDNRNAFSLRNLILYTFLMILYLYIAPGQGQRTLGDKLLMSTESPYHFDHLLRVSNKSLWILILYTFLNVFSHVYSPGAGADSPLWTKSDVNRKALPLCPFVASFKNKAFKSDFIHIFACFFFIHLYSPGAEADNPLGSECLF